MKNKKILLVALILIGVAIAVWYYFRSQSYESTDNAFVDGDIIQVSPRVPGQVLRVHVADNQHVNKGDVLAGDRPGRLSGPAGGGAGEVETTRWPRDPERNPTWRWRPASPVPSSSRPTRLWRRPGSRSLC